MRVESHGISTELPPGWEAEITVRPESEEEAALATGEQTTMPVAHLANFPLPPERGDFGSNAVEIMTADDVLVCLIEFDRGSAGTRAVRTGGHSGAHPRCVLTRVDAAGASRPERSPGVLQCRRSGVLRVRGPREPHPPSRDRRDRQSTPGHHPNHPRRLARFSIFGAFPTVLGRRRNRDAGRGAAQWARRAWSSGGCGGTGCVSPPPTPPHRTIRTRTGGSGCRDSREAHPASAALRGRTPASVSRFGRVSVENETQMLVGAPAVGIRSRGVVSR